VYMENSENTKIVPSATIAKCWGGCDLEYEHEGHCVFLGDNDDDDYDDCGNCGDCELCEENSQKFYEDDVWADSNALASAGWGTDEDYGFYGDDY